MPKYIPSLGMTNPMTTQGDLISGGPGGEPKRLAPGTSGQFLKTQGTGADPVWGTPIVAFQEGDILLASANTERYTSNTTMTKVKEIKIYREGTLRIYFEMKTSTEANPVYAQVYRNNSPVGTLRSSTSQSYTGYTEDISGWSPNDLVQLYHRSGSTAIRCYVQNFQIKVRETDAITVNLD
jgi:hypothetical protein